MAYARARILRVTLSSCLLAALAACGGATIKQNSFDRGAAQSANSPGAGAELPNQWPQSSVTLSWTPPVENTDGSHLGDLAGYKIYSGPSVAQLDVRATLSNPGLATYVIDDLQSDEICFAIAAFNRKGVESARSGVVYRPMS